IVSLSFPTHQVRRSGFRKDREMKTNEPRRNRKAIDRYQASTPTNSRLLSSPMPGHPKKRQSRTYFLAPRNRFSIMRISCH
ncbi:MAG: hypothetical protein RKP46_08060, partial [Candidatus Accumulibacter sp.]|uniref:hypothetical protein n=1 Tax=Accumulibacter sp. TaxID=2053492 RepID=UPI00287AB6D1